MKFILTTITENHGFIIIHTYVHIAINVFVINFITFTYSTPMQCQIIMMSLVAIITVAISFSITQKSTSQNEEHYLKWLFLTTKQFCY